MIFTMTNYEKGITVAELVMVKGKFLGTSDPLGCINGKVYEIIGLDNGYIRVIDELKDDYLYPPTDFEIVEGSITELKERED